jgi:hypothetical protein
MKKRKAVKRKKGTRVSDRFNTVGVRFMEGSKLFQVYTYKVRVGVKVHLGQELVADTDRGPVLVAIVRLDKKPFERDNDGFNGELKWITRKVTPL